MSTKREKAPGEIPAERAEQGSSPINQKLVQPSKPQKHRWAKRGIRIGAGFLAIVVLLLLSYVAALAIDIGPVTAYRMLTSGDSNINTYKIFPQRAVATGGSGSTLQQAPLANFPTTITYSYHGSQYTTRLSDLRSLSQLNSFRLVRVLFS